MAIREIEGKSHAPALLLRPQIDIFRADMIAGSFGYEPLSAPTLDTLDLDDVSSVRESMSKFAENLGQGGINDMVGKRLKNGGADLQGRNFYIESPLSRSNYMNYGYFFRDGRECVILGAESENEGKYSLGLAVAGIDFPKDTGGNPLIVQLQSFSPLDVIAIDAIPLALEASSVLGQLRWEKLLVDIAMAWARAENFPFIYIQPGERNHWLDVNYALRDRVGLRYDVTAERMGFEKMSHGLWGYKL